VSPEHEHMLDLLTVLSGLHGKLVSFEAKVLKTEQALLFCTCRGGSC